MKAIERVYQYIDYKRIKPIPFEKKINLSNGYLGKQKRRNADLGESILNKIIENCPEINPTWLLTGKGEMLLNNNKEENIAGEPAAVYKVTPPVQEEEPPQASVLQYEIQSLKERIKDKEEIIYAHKERINLMSETINSQKDRLKEREDIISSQKEKLKEGQEKTAKDGVFIQRLKKQLAELQEKWAELNKKLLEEKKDYRSLMDTGGSVPSKLSTDKPSIIQVERNIKKQRPRK